MIPKLWSSKERIPRPRNRETLGGCGAVDAEDVPVRRCLEPLSCGKGMK